MRKQRWDFYLATALIVSAAAWLTPPAWGQANIRDCEGYLWDLSNGGMVNDGGNDTFDGGMQLRINGMHFSSGRSRSARNGREFIFGPQRMGNLQVTRKVYIPAKKYACARYLEIIENTGNAPTEVRVSIYSNLGGSAQQTIVPDPKNGGVVYEAVGQGAGQRCSVGFRFGDDGGRFRAQFQVQGDNVFINFAKPLRLKPKQRAVILHVVAQRRSANAAADYVKKFKLGVFLRGLDEEDRRLVVNARAGSGLFSLGGLELFRGEHGDAVKLRTGELLSGELKTPSFTLSGDFGDRTFAGKEIISLFGERGDKLRVVLQSGEVLSGTLKEPKLNLKLRNGTVLAIPTNLVAKYGRRLPKAPDGKAAKGERFVFTAPIFILRGGDQLVGKPSQPKLTVRTLYGEIPLSMGVLKAAVFPNHELRTPVFKLRDGSTVSGLPAELRFNLKLRDGKAISLGVGRVAAIYFAPAGLPDTAATNAARENEDAPKPPLASRLKLLNGDVLFGKLEGDNNGLLVVETPFGRQQVGAAQVRRLRFRPRPFRAVRVTLWDGITLPSTLPGEALSFTLAATGTKLTIPFGMIVSYSAPAALPPPAEVKELEALITKLGDNDPEIRKGAQAELLRKGPGIRGVLLQHWNEEDLETKVRVRKIYKQLQDAAVEDEEEKDEEAVSRLPNSMVQHYTKVYGGRRRRVLIRRIR